MAFAGPTTSGYSAAGHLDGSIALVVRDGYTAAPGTQAALATSGFGANTDIGWIVRSGFCAFPGLAEPIPANKQYKDVAGLPWTPPALSILQGASPAAVNGDVMVVDKVSTPGGYAITLNANGTFAVAVNGDTARQSFLASRFISATGVNDGTYINWVNNVPPAQAFIAAEIDVNVGDNLSPVDLNSYIRDLEGDAITYSIDPSTLPSGVKLSGSIISGIPLVAGGFTPAVTATDITGDSSLLFPLSIVVGSSTTLQDSIFIAVNAGLVVTQPIDWAYSSTVPYGNVISQSPAQGTVVPLSTPVHFVVSLGPAPAVMQSTVPNVIGLFIQDAQNAITNAGCGWSRISWQYSSNIPGNIVINQSVPAGTLVPKGTIVILTVSQGAPVTPLPGATVVVPQMTF